MASRIPLVRQLAWPGIAVQYLILSGLFSVVWITTARVRPESLSLSLLAVPVLYLAYVGAGRLLLAWHHRSGMRLMAQGRYAEAIPCFQASYAFFLRHRWLDRYRALVLASPTAMSHAEIALCNIAFAYTRMDDNGRAKAYYQMVLRESPDNTLAHAALVTLAATERASVEGAIRRANAA
jgi:tetratricopeptide (TPR) repeat protein